MLERLVKTDERFVKMDERFEQLAEGQVRILEAIFGEHSENARYLITLIAEVPRKEASLRT